MGGNMGRVQLKKGANYEERPGKKQDARPADITPLRNCCSMPFERSSRYFRGQTPARLGEKPEIRT
jgi:hypothetical protein